MRARATSEAIEAEAGARAGEGEEGLAAGAGARSEEHGDARGRGAGGVPRAGVDAIFAAGGRRGDRPDQREEDGQAEQGEEREAAGQRGRGGEAGVQALQRGEGDVGDRAGSEPEGAGAPEHAAGRVAPRGAAGQGAGDAEGSLGFESGPPLDHLDQHRHDPPNVPRSYPVRSISAVSPRRRRKRQTSPVVTAP